MENTLTIYTYIIIYKYLCFYITRVTPLFLPPPSTPPAGPCLTIKPTVAPLM